MYTDDEVDAQTLHLLRTASRGKDPAGRPKALSSYQLCTLFDDAMAEHFISAGGLGATEGFVAGRSSFTRVVLHSLRRLERRRWVRHYYMDTRALSIDVKGTLVKPTYPVMAIYQYTGPLMPQAG